jgi:hypothetical protein
MLYWRYSQVLLGNASLENIAGTKLRALVECDRCGYSSACLKVSSVRAHPTTDKR